MPNASATAGTTRSGSVTGASGTKNTPFGKSSTSSAPTCNARRVLPVPPNPVAVTSRTSSRRISSAMSRSSCSRPTNGVSCVGRFVGLWSSVFSGGNVGGSPSPTNWNKRCGSARSFSRCSPRSSSPKSVLSSSSKSRVVCETRTCPPWPAAQIRAQRWTPVPK